MHAHSFNYTVLILSFFKKSVFPSESKFIGSKGWGTSIVASPGFAWCFIYSCPDNAIWMETSLAQFSLSSSNFEFWVIVLWLVTLFSGGGEWSVDDLKDGINVIVNFTCQLSIWVGRLTICPPYWVDIIPSIEGLKRTREQKAERKGNSCLFSLLHWLSWNI